MRFVIILSTMAILLVCSGCGGTSEQKTREIDRIKIENSDLRYKLDGCQKQSKRLSEQVATLSSIDPNQRLEDLYNLENVDIGTFTNLYDKNEDGKTESLIVYIQPLDNTGDCIKAAGKINIQLWDINNSPKEALLGEWDVSPAELKKLWFGSLFSGNYRLVFDVSGKISGYNSPLIVKMVFTDYLSGKVFREQKTIEP